MISFGNFGTGKFLYEWKNQEYRNLKFSVNHKRYIANPVQVTNIPHEWVRRRCGKNNSFNSSKDLRSENMEEDWGLGTGDQ